MCDDHGFAVGFVVVENAHDAVRGAMHEGRERLAAVRVPVPVERTLDRLIPQADVKALAQWLTPDRSEISPAGTAELSPGR